MRQHNTMLLVDILLHLYATCADVATDCAIAVAANAACTTAAEEHVLRWP
jgi:hypothetical protein